ncbi:hypothetical protein BGZ82_005958, partial [Podila clonocystis]
SPYGYESKSSTSALYNDKMRQENHISERQAIRQGAGDIHYRKWPRSGTTCRTFLSRKRILYLARQWRWRQTSQKSPAIQKQTKSIQLMPPSHPFMLRRSRWMRALGYSSD